MDQKPYKLEVYTDFIREYGCTCCGRMMYGGELYKKDDESGEYNLVKEFDFEFTFQDDLENAARKFICDSILEIA